MNKILKGILIALFLTLPAVHAWALEEDEASAVTEAGTGTSGTAAGALPESGLEKPDNAASVDKEDLEEVKETYTLNPGDKVMIKIYPEDQYIHGGDMQISPDGNVTLPIVGKVKLQGLSAMEAARKIQVILDKDYLVQPEVIVEIMRYKEQSFIVLGQVRKPGTYQVPVGTSGISLLQAVSLAGGFSDVANIKKIKIVRNADGVKKIMRVNAEAIISGKDEDLELKAGDVVHVSESLF